MYKTNHFRSQPNRAFEKFPCFVADLSISEDEFWQMRRNLDLVGPYDVRMESLYFTNPGMNETQDFASITSGEFKDEILSPSDDVEGYVIHNLIRRGLMKYLEECGFHHKFKLFYNPRENGYIRSTKTKEATYVVYRGFKPKITVISEDCNVDIRFSLEGRYEIEINTNQWESWVGEAIKVTRESGIDQTRIYHLDEVNLQTKTAQISSDNQQFDIMLSNLYVPANSSILKKKNQFPSMHEFRNFASGLSVFDFLEDFLKTIAPKQTFLLELSDNECHKIEFKLLGEEVPTKW